MNLFDELRTFVRVSDRVAEGVDVAEHATQGPSISVVHTQASRHSAKVRVFADFAARLLRDWSQRIHALAGA